MIPEHVKKLGYYQHNGNDYPNKWEALANCPAGEHVHWNFNDEIYSKYDWSKEPIHDLYELYKMRAIQIREEYDNVIVYFSGGIDSVCAIRSFLDNNIKVDAVIMYGTWNFKDAEKYAFNLEQFNIGMPLLKEYQKIQDFELILLDTYQFYHNYVDESWIYSTGQLCTPAVYINGFFHQDAKIQRYLMSGSTCFVRGMEKPRVMYDQHLGKWQAGFLDTSFLGSPSGELAIKNKWDLVEYFFWSPNLPELAIKQARIVYNYISKLVNAKELFKKHDNKNYSTDEYQKIVDPLIYGKYTTQQIGKEKTYYSLPKAFDTPNKAYKDGWFWDKEISTESWVKVWNEGIRLIDKTINKSHYNDPTKSIELTSLVGSWSKMHNLE